MSIDEAAVYFELRRFGVSRVTKRTVELVKYLLLLHYANMPITAAALAFLARCSISNALAFLHRLGDFGLLELEVRDHQYVFHLNPDFAKRFDPKL